MILPQPTEAFEWISGPSRALVCRPLTPFAQHIFTSRLWPLGTTSGAHAEESWADVALALGVDPRALLRAHQVHGTNAVMHRPGRPIAPAADADIVATDDPAAAAAIQTADCVAVLLVDTRTGAVAAAHAGWRGLAQRTLRRTVETMVEAFGTRESKLVAAIGPAIGACCYEVGSEVRDRFAAAGFEDWELARWFSTEARPTARNPPLPGLNVHGRDGHWFLDLWAAASDQLRAAGVREDRVFVAELCTASHPELLCSYRRDGASSGRMAAAIRMK